MKGKVMMDGTKNNASYADVYNLETIEEAEKFAKDRILSLIK